MASDSEARPLCEITMNHDVGLRVRGYGSLASSLLYIIIYRKIGQLI